VAKNLGHVSGADGGYKVGTNSTLIPDVGFVSREHVPELSGSIFTVALDLAVEVISPSETQRKVLAKVQDYLRLGTKLIWAVYPEENVVDVYRPADDGVIVQTVDLNGTLDGGDVVPGFKLAVKEIFAV
jgi:Uma2 family endonuclease